MINKFQRKLKERTKFKKRLKNYGFSLEDARNPNNNLHVFKTTGRPCSCWCCKRDRFNRKEKHKNKQID